MAEEHLLTVPHCRLSVRDSFDEEDPSDVDDEVFIKDGRNGSIRSDDECRLKRPLMPPRRKRRSHYSEHRVPYRTLYTPLCYALAGFTVVLILIMLCVLLVFELPFPVNKVKNWLATESKESSLKPKLEPCISLNSKVIWTKTFPKLTSEAPLQSNDVNGDNIADIIVGYSTGLDRADSPDYVCTLYFGKNAPCLGGAMAIDGSSGETLWTHWTNHAVFSIDCTLDLNKDRTKDCLITGRGGILHAVNGRDGTVIWEYRDLSILSDTFYNVYDAKYIADVDNDGIGDIITSYTWQTSSAGVQSELILVSGKTGAKIQILDLSTKEQIFVAPQTIVQPDGKTFIIIAASDAEKSGGLYAIPRSKLLKGDFKLQEIYHGTGRGVSLPPVLVDINSDGTEDIVVATYRSTVLAFDGLTFNEIWNYTVPNSVIISIPIPGYYNEDKIPDFMVKHQIGPSYPVFYYTKTTILDGRTGVPFLKSPIEDTMSAQMSGLSVTVDYGNDWFLYWSSDCLNHEGAKVKYDFLKNPSPDADLCKLRFNSSLSTTLYALSRHVKPPGIAIYKSEDWKAVEFNNSIDPRKIAEDFANQHSANEIESNRSKNRFKNINNSNKIATGQENEDYYPRLRTNQYLDNSAQQHENFLDTALNELNQNRIQSNDNDGQKQPDELYDDDDSEEMAEEERRRLMDSQRMNEIRYQRSKTYSGRYINNDTNDVHNTYDPSMDYTNGQSKHHSYYSSLNFNRSSNIDDSDYSNMPDVDFVDNIKDAEALARRKKRQANAIYGVQRQPPTGILLPPLKPSHNRNSVDLVFSTYWLPASQMPFVLLPPDLECLEEAVSKIGLDLVQDQKETIIGSCLAKRNLDYQTYDEAMDKENSRIPLGQMTLYRMQLRCGCAGNLQEGQKCQDLAKKQSWPAHLGKTGGGYFIPLDDN